MVRKRLLAIMLAICLVAVYVFFGVDYLGQDTQKEVLYRGISDAREALALIAEMPGDTEERLAAVQAGLTAVQNEFPTEVDTTLVVSTILMLGEECGVKVLPLATEAWSSSEVGGHEYPVFRVEIDVEGEFLDTMDFLSMLESTEFKTLILGDLNISSDGGPLGEGSLDGETSLMTANLELAVYARPETYD